MRTILSVCLLFAFALSAGAAETRTYVLDDLAITYDPAHWTFAQVAEGDPLRAQPKVVRATCIGCRGEAFVTISVADIAREESETVLDPAWARDRRQSTLAVGELTIGVTTIHSPCRNYVPPSMTARAAYRGRTYNFRSGVIVGCHGWNGVGRERLEELLRGLHPRRS